MENFPLWLLSKATLLVMRGEFAAESTTSPSIALRADGVKAVALIDSELAARAEIGVSA